MKVRFLFDSRYMTNCIIMLIHRYQYDYTYN